MINIKKKKKKNPKELVIFTFLNMKLLSVFFFVMFPIFDESRFLVKHTQHKFKIIKLTQLASSRDLYNSNNSKVDFISYLQG